MAFDVEAAKKAGYSDAEIAEHLATSAKLDIGAARQAGYSDKELIEHYAAKDAPSRVGSFLRGVVQNATFGFGDELRAGTDALVQGATNLVTSGGPSMGQAYDTSLAKSREDLRRDVEVNPVSSTAGQIAGGVGTAALVPAAGVAKVAAPFLGPVNRLLAGVPGWLGVPAGIVAGGAASGGVQGFGEGEGGLGSRLESGGLGAGVGAVVAPAIRGAVAAVPAALGRVGHALGWRNAETAADRQIVRALDRGGVSVDEAATRLQQAGDTPTALVDVGGRNVVNLGATAANTPGASMDVADKFAEARRYGRPGRMAAVGDEVFGGGSGTDVAQARAGLRDARQVAADPLYERSFKIQPTEDEYARVAPWVNDKIGQEGMQRGLRVIELEHLAEGKTFNPKDYGVTRGEGGKFVPVEGQTPNMRLLDAVKRGYDVIVEDYRDATSGRLDLSNPYVRAVDQNRRAYRDSLAEMYHPYRRALQAWAGPSAQLDAIEAGKTAFKTDRDIVADRMTRAADEQDAYRLGAGRDFSDRLGRPSTAGGVATTLLEDTNMQQRLASILDQQQLDALNAALRRESNMANVEKAVSPRAGAQTARLMAGGADMGTDVAGPVMTGIRQALSGNIVGGVGTVANDLVMRRLGQGINPATADALANRLFVTDPTGRQRVTDALRNRLLEDALRAEQARRMTLPVVRSLSQTAGGYAGRP